MRKKQYSLKQKNITKKLVNAQTSNTSEIICEIVGSNFANRLKLSKKPDTMRKELKMKG